MGFFTQIGSERMHSHYFKSAEAVKHFLLYCDPNPLVGIQLRTERPPRGRPLMPWFLKIVRNLFKRNLKANIESLAEYLRRNSMHFSLSRM